MNYTFSDKINPLKPSAIREILKYASNSDIISFAAGNPAPESFPVKEMKEISSDIYENMPSIALQYGITEGYGPLRAAILDRLKNKYGLVKEYDDLLITSGAQQGIDLLAKVLCNEGDTVVCENPSFIGALNAFRAYNVNLVGVELKEDGVDIGALELAFKTSKNVRFFYVIPNFQNPSGLTTSFEKRKQIYELCKRYGVIILEDDPYGELRFKGNPIPAIKSMDEEGLVVYMNTFSKIISAGIRVGCALGPSEIISKITVAKQVNDVHTNLFFQILIYEFMKRYDLDAHIKKIQDIYRKKSALMIQGLKDNLPGEITYFEPDGGLFIWCEMSRGDGAELAKACIEKKVAIVPGTAFLVDESKGANFRLNYSTPSDDAIIKGTAILGGCARKYFKGI